MCPLTAANCRYLHASRYDDQITVQTWVRSYNGVRLSMAYVIWLEGRPISEGETDHAFVCNGKPIAVKRSFPVIHDGLMACLVRDKA